MKTLMNLTALILLSTLLGSCSDDSPNGEPHYIRIFFSFVTDENGDFFMANADYDITKVSATGIRINSIMFLDGLNVFETTSQSFEAKINFGNGDIDTLNVIWEPADLFRLKSNEEVKKATFIYNNKVIETWDFENNTELLFDLAKRNVPDRDTWNNDPIIVKIIKTN